MKRYDPSQPISQKSSKSHATQIEKKKSKMKKKRIEETNELMETVKPLVSKEKHYSVSANLKEAFNRNCDDVSFSLSAMFDAQLEKSNYLNVTLTLDTYMIAKILYLYNDS